MNDFNYTKTMKRKNEEASDSDDDKPFDLVGRRKKRFDDKKKKAPSKKIDELLPDYVLADVSDKQLLSHLFHGKEFTVMPLEGCGYTTQEIEEKILLNDGRVSKNPLKSTRYIVMNH